MALGSGVGVMDKIIFMTAVFSLGFLFGLDVDHSEAKTYDEKKWERLQANREKRQYEACTFQCLKGCVK